MEESGRKWYPVSIRYKWVELGREGNLEGLGVIVRGWFCGFLWIGRVFIRKIYQYMKNKIKLNESTLKQIIAESMRKVLGENTVDEKRFMPILKKTYNNLYSEYERWQYTKYKPQGMDEAIDAILNAMSAVNDIIERIEPLPENPHLDDYMI